MATACKAPTSVTINGAVLFTNRQIGASSGYVVEYRPGVPLSISWAGAAGGVANAIVGYDVMLYNLLDATYDTVLSISSTATSGTASYTPDAYTDRGKTVVARVRTRGAAGSTYYSGYTDSQQYLRNLLPTAVSVHYPASNEMTTYNSRPRVLMEVFREGDGGPCTLSGASDYTYSSVLPYNAKQFISRKTAELAESGIHEVYEHTVDLLGAANNADDEGADTPAVTVDYTPAVYTDTLTAGGTRIKAVHMNELRTMIDTMRDYYGLAAYSWAEAITAQVTSMAGWAVHIGEMRTAIEEIASLVNAWDTTSYTNRIVLPTWITIVGKQPTAAVMQQIRDVIPTL